MGYGDGVPRVATGAPVMIEGRTYPVVGRIAMDQMVVDLRTTEDMSHLLGAEAVLFGGEGAPSVREWSEVHDTIWRARSLGGCFRFGQLLLRPAVLVSPFPQLRKPALLQLRSNLCTLVAHVEGILLR